MSDDDLKDEREHAALNAELATSNKLVACFIHAFEHKLSDAVIGALVNRARTFLAAAQGETR